MHAGLWIRRIDDAQIEVKVVNTDWQLWRPEWRGGNSAALESRPAPAQGLPGLALGLLTVLGKFLVMWNHSSLCSVSHLLWCPVWHRAQGKYLMSNW